MIMIHQNRWILVLLSVWTLNLFFFLAFRFCLIPLYNNTIVGRSMESESVVFTFRIEIGNHSALDLLFNCLCNLVCFSCERCETILWIYFFSFSFFFSYFSFYFIFFNFNVFNQIQKNRSDCAPEKMIAFLSFIVYGLMQLLAG